VVILTIKPVPEKLDRDIALPVLSPILTRKKSLAEEIAALEVSRFQCPTLPRKEGDQEAQNFKYEGHDILTLEKIVERDNTIPAPQTAEEVIGYYACRIAQEIKLPSQFAALVPKVKRNRRCEPVPSAPARHLGYWSVRSLNPTKSRTCLETAISVGSRSIAWTP
jgi:type III restriction enzyme